MPRPAGEETGQQSQVLTGIVGTEEDPDAFVLTLLDAEGEQVSTLPAGEYEVQVTDHSAIHDVHLAGPGVDQSTTVPETVETTWTVTLEARESTCTAATRTRAWSVAAGPWFAAGQVTPAGLFVAEAVVSAAAALWVLVQSSRLAWPAVAVVGVSSTPALLVAAYVRSPAWGPCQRCTSRSGTPRRSSPPSPRR